MLNLLTEKPALLLFGIVMTFVVTPHAAAQGNTGASCTIGVGGGWAPNVGKNSGNFNQGWVFQADGGFFFAGAPNLFVGPDFIFDQAGISQTGLQNAKLSNTTNTALLSATAGKAKFITATLDVKYRIPGAHGLYVFGGYGLLRRTLDFTGVSTQGGLLQPTSPTVFGKGGNSGAFAAGAGVNFKNKKRHWPMFYAEVRVVHGFAVNSTTTLLPLSAGIRW
jgi:Outer membrane protein beta-barrel domain